VVDQFNGRGLIPKLYHFIVVFSFEKKSELYLGTFPLHDALHLLGRIPDWHIACTTIRQTAWGRGTNGYQLVLRIFLQIETPKVGLKGNTIKGSGHELLLSH